ncbi:MAG TPA: FxsA family protein [Rhodobacteraceae bacterium]|nr:FxsA family protein [Paracoccaceae bacterium]
MWLFLILVGVPIIEIGLFIELGGFLGLWPTLGIVVLTALLGTLLLRTQGLSTLEELKRTAETGQSPAGPMANGALILVAGLLLLTPGFFTDSFGFLLMVPPFRALLIKWIAARAQMKIYASAANSQQAPDIIDGEFEIVDDDEAGDSGWTKRP